MGEQVEKNKMRLIIGKEIGGSWIEKIHVGRIWFSEGKKPIRVAVKCFNSPLDIE